MTLAAATSNSNACRTGPRIHGGVARRADDHSHHRPALLRRRPVLRRVAVLGMVARTRLRLFLQAAAAGMDHRIVAAPSAATADPACGAASPSCYFGTSLVDLRHRRGTLRRAGRRSGRRCVLRSARHRCSPPALSRPTCRCCSSGRWRCWPGSSSCAGPTGAGRCAGACARRRHAGEVCDGLFPARHRHHRRCSIAPRARLYCAGTHGWRWCWRW